MTVNPNIIIKAKGINKYYGDNLILDNIDLDIETGERIAIIGRSGCGKTTLLRALNCIDIIDKGSIFVDGIMINRDKDQARNSLNIFRANVPFSGIGDNKNIDEDLRKKAQSIRLKVGMLFQSLNLFPHKTVIDNVMLGPLVVKKESKSQAQLRAVQLLEKVGMEKYTERYPSELSGGQKQRVAIARALALSPKIMMYDEPTSALDPELVNEVFEVMKNLNKEGMTQIIVTHDLNFARHASDKIIYMDSGCIIEYGRTEKLLTNPESQLLREYLERVML